MKNILGYLLTLVTLIKVTYIGSVINSENAKDVNEIEANDFKDKMKLVSTISSLAYATLFFQPFTKDSTVIETKDKTMFFMLVIGNIITVLLQYEKNKDNDEKEDTVYYLKLANMFFILAASSYILTITVPGTPDVEISKGVLISIFLANLFPLALNIKNYMEESEDDK